MSDAIEIRSDGEIVSRYMKVGHAVIDVPWKADFTGVFFSDDPDDALREALEEAEADAAWEAKRAHTAEQDLEDIKDEIATIAEKAPKAIKKALEALL